MDILIDEFTIVAQIKFTNVAAVRFANEGHAKYIAPDAINQVIEILDNSWVSDLRKPALWPFVQRHFALFVESVGYYEVLAEEVAYIES